jgi:predicted homoserine dehydrogenase-like protein
MDHSTLLDGARTLVAGVVGAGEFGASFVYRSMRAPGLRVAGAADTDLERAVRVAERAGIDRVARCDSPAKAKAAFERGEFIACASADILCALELDFVVEATGSPEGGARTAAAALAAGRNVAMVSKECDSVVGPILQAKAADAGLIHTPVDGDQPSLLVGLVTWARTLGLEILCAGKASEFDFVSEELQELPVLERPQRGPDRPRRTPPDLCELGIVANATGLMPDTPRLHAPIARTLELPEIFRPQGEGGLLARTGVVDMFNCLRRPDEQSFAGGVFVNVRCDDLDTWRVLAEKGIPTSADGRCAMLHNPVHLLGIEAPITLLQSMVLKRPAATLAPRVDLVGRAATKLLAGTLLEAGERHSIPGVEPELADAAPARGANAVPFYMVQGCRLTADVAAGALLTRDCLEPPSDSVLWKLRAEQDAKFFA